VTALDGASFVVHPGELLGLLGPNGAGKTTLIRAIAGRVALDDGEIAIAGRPVTIADARPGIGVVPQELAIYPKLTARENLRAFGELYGVPAAALRERIEWALTWADLTDRAKEPVERFSGGMKRRLNIAIGLLHQPTVVLLDEPTVGVDPQSRERIYEMLAALQRDGVSVVLTTHHLEEAERRCSRIVIIDHGRTIATGTVPSLVQQYGGGARHLRVVLSAAWPDAAPLPQGMARDASGCVLEGQVQQVGRDVSEVLGAVAAVGAPVRDIALAGGSLQDVFIGLTGRELRE
jgi:ABC-2 type transport system ATP-binding protein